MKLNIKCLLPLILLTACGGGGGGGSKKGTTKLPEPLPGPSSNCAIDDIICLNQPKTCVPPLVLDPSTNLCQFVRHDSNNCGENEIWNAAKEKCEKPVAVSCPDGQTRNPQTKKCETVIIPSQAKANFTLIFHDHIVANDGEYSIAVISARGLEVGEKVIERTAEWKGACDAKLRWADEEMDSELLLSSTALEDQSCSLTGKVLTNKGRTIEVDRAEINIEKRHFKITEVNANNVLTVMGPKAQMLLFEVQTNSQSKVTSKVDSATPGCKFAFDGLFILTGVYEGAAASEKCSVTVSFRTANGFSEVKKTFDFKIEAPKFNLSVTPIAPLPDIAYGNDLKNVATYAIETNLAPENYSLSLTVTGCDNVQYGELNGTIKVATEVARVRKCTFTLVAETQPGAAQKLSASKSFDVQFREPRSAFRIVDAQSSLYYREKEQNLAKLVFEFEDSSLKVVAVDTVSSCTNLSVQSNDLTNIQVKSLTSLPSSETCTIQVTPRLNNKILPTQTLNVRMVKMTFSLEVTVPEIKLNDDGSEYLLPVILLYFNKDSGGMQDGTNSESFHYQYTSTKAECRSVLNVSSRATNGFLKMKANKSPFPENCDFALQATLLGDYFASDRLKSVPLSVSLIESTSPSFSLSIKSDVANLLSPTEWLAIGTYSIQRLTDRFPFTHPEATAVFNAECAAFASMEVNQDDIFIVENKENKVKKPLNCSFHIEANKVDPNMWGKIFKSQVFSFKLHPAPFVSAQYSVDVNGIQADVTASLTDKPRFARFALANAAKDYFLVPKAKVETDLNAECDAFAKIEVVENDLYLIADPRKMTSDAVACSVTISMANINTEMPTQKLTSSPLEFRVVKEPVPGTFTTRIIDCRNESENLTASVTINEKDSIARQGMIRNLESGDMLGIIYALGLNKTSSTPTQKIYDVCDKSVQMSCSLTSSVKPAITVSRDEITISGFVANGVGFFAPVTFQRKIQCADTFFYDR